MQKIEIYKVVRWTPRGRKTEWRWRFVHSNGNILANGGQAYSNRQDLESALRTLSTQFSTAPRVVV